MKHVSYRKMKKMLISGYFKPDDESKKELIDVLCIDRGRFEEQRFVAKFRIGLAAAIAAACVVGFLHVTPEKQIEHGGEVIIALGKLITDSSIPELFVIDTKSK